MGVPNVGGVLAGFCTLCCRALGISKGRAGEDMVVSDSEEAEMRAGAVWGRRAPQ